MLPSLKFYFHSGELYHPCTFEYYIDNSILYEKYTDTLVSKTNLSQRDCKGDRNNYQLLANKEDIKYGFQNLEKVPLYGYSKILQNKLYITLFLFYAFNGPYNILFLEEAGYHWGDLERIVLEYEKDELTRIYYGAHGDRDGRWLDIKDIEREDEYLVFYISRYSHGFYPQSGIYWRIFGLANDITDKGKNIIFTNYTNISELGYFCGLIGLNGISSFMSKSWINEIPIEDKPPILIGKLSYNIYFIFISIILFSIFFFLYIIGIYTLKRLKYVYFSILISGLAISIYKLKLYIRNVSA